MDRAVVHYMASRWGLLTAILLLSLVTQDAVANEKSMRCGVHVIYAGDNKDSARMFEVLKKCGEPAIKQGNMWIYFDGGVRRELTFNHENRLKKIASFRS